MRILLLRHGQSTGNVNERIQGPDDPLTDHGRRQAALLGQHLEQHYNIDHVISSALIRAHETAQISTASFGQPIALESRFAEIMAGDAVGMLWADWRIANPEKAAVWGWDTRHADAGWDGGESGRDLCHRAFAAWDELLGTLYHPDETVAIVTHGGVIAWLAARFNGDDLNYWPGPYAEIANCSITEIDVRGDGAATIAAWNQTAHLGDAFASHVSPVLPNQPHEVIEQ